MLELHAIALKRTEENGEFAVAMTTRERHRFLGDLLSGSELNLYTIWLNINAEISDCSRPEDRKSIHDGILSGCGFARLNRDVVGVMEEWILGQMRLNAAVALEANDIALCARWNIGLCVFAFLLGKPEDGMRTMNDVLNNIFIERFAKESGTQFGEWGAHFL